jgi:hypothetical protein
LAIAVRRAGKGGGYLNGVSGTIESITFKSGKTGVNKEGKPWTLYTGVVNIKADGADVSKPQFLDAGFLYGDNTISADGLTIEGDDRYMLDGDTGFGRFIVSLNEGEGNRVPDDVIGDCRNYDALAGTRVTFARVINVEATIAAGLRKLKLKKVTDENREKVIDAGKREAKKDGKPVIVDGKPQKFMLDDLLVTEVLSLPEAGGKKAPAKKVAAKPAAKAAPKAAAVETNTDSADAAIRGVLEGAAENTIARTGISSAFVKYALGQPDLKANSAGREALRKVVISDDYLNDAAERGVIILDGEAKDQTVQLVA